MSYGYSQGAALAGEIGKGNFASAKTTSERNEGATVLNAGIFVALGDKGVKALSAKADVLAGVIVRSIIKDEWAQNDLLDVIHIAPADAIWVQVVKGETVKRGNPVHVLAVTKGDKKAGAIQGKEDAANTIPTDYHVIDVANELALITKL